MDLMTAAQFEAKLDKLLEEANDGELDIREQVRILDAHAARLQYEIGVNEAE